jgi:hypothetical protein
MWRSSQFLPHLQKGVDKEFWRFMEIRIFSAVGHSGLSEESKKSPSTRKRSNDALARYRGPHKKKPTSREMGFSSPCRNRVFDGRIIFDGFNNRENLVIGS